MQVVRAVGKSKALIVTTTILGAALGIAIALSTPKKYEATTELIVDPRDLKLTDRDLTQSVIASDATLAIVESRATSEPQNSSLCRTKTCRFRVNGMGRRFGGIACWNFRENAAL